MFVTVLFTFRIETDMGLQLMNVEHFGDLCLHKFENDTPIRLIRCVCGVQL